MEFQRVDFCVSLNSNEIPAYDFSVVRSGRGIDTAFASAFFTMAIDLSSACTQRYFSGTERGRTLT
eukprot:COSAG03_NODE_1461_length_4042_cov_2.075323_1_plen_66_part_00